MSCAILQRRLLSLERPDDPPADLRPHLAACTACRAWHRRLIDVERDAACLPVPPPERLGAFLQTFLGEKEPAPVATLHFPPAPLAPPRNPTKERALRKMALAFALAASLLLVAFGVWAWKHEPAPGPVATDSVIPTDPLTARLAGKPAWAKAGTAEERLRVLSDLADEVRQEARRLTEGTDLAELNRRVDLYRQVIHKITAEEAPRVALEERQRVLVPIADRLIRAESEAERLVARLTDGPADAMDQLAAVARDGNRRLRDLLRSAST